MNYQKEIPAELLEVYKQRYGHLPWNYTYIAWPHTFGSTAGPHGGMGAQAMSTFTIECYYDDEKDISMLLCDGEYDFVKGFINYNDSLQKVKWKKLIVIPKEENKSNFTLLNNNPVELPTYLSKLTNPKNPD